MWNDYKDSAKSNKIQTDNKRRYTTDRLIKKQTDWFGFQSGMEEAASRRVILTQSKKLNWKNNNSS